MNKETKSLSLYRITFTKDELATLEAALRDHNDMLDRDLRPGDRAEQEAREWLADVEAMRAGFARALETEGC